MSTTTTTSPSFPYMAQGGPTYTYLGLCDGVCIEGFGVLGGGNGAWECVPLL
jgi:hypothetical protein